MRLNADHGIFGRALNRVEAGAAIEARKAGTRSNKESVVAATAVQNILTAIAIDEIVACSAGDAVIARTAANFRNADQRRIAEIEHDAGRCALDLHVGKSAGIDRLDTLDRADADPCTIARRDD